MAAHRSSDGFTVQFPYLPGGLEDFVNHVVPELQRRGIFRSEYEGKTLRENLGLPRPRTGSFRTARARSISLAIGTTIWCDARFAPCRDG